MSTYIHLQDAQGQIVLREAHVSPAEARQGLESFNVIRWQDEAGTWGQDSVARMVNFLKNGGSLAIEVDDRLRAVVVSSTGTFLITQDATPDEDPLLALPPFTEH
ncbi:hypothetical protein QE370_003479 [Aeromicrobium sp. SORGH_AS981]|uniref:hypothetical protein n=1 Tax=Aeromicrobium sp. SORGH_AS_0981 TaxID=3041802 RepID=UPI002854E2E6|nr:hypothetical protein [Aeromicrobium sp. SORGH_AS_0981]MDR6120295.1 hypothetical protein [Aeromicrobium sp. SORGH_AS_0981]